MFKIQLNKKFLAMWKIKFSEMNGTIIEKILETLATTILIIHL